MLFDNNFTNRTFRTNLQPERPYYYVTASLDLTGARNGETLYFNADNNLDYLNNRNYAKYHILTQDLIIGDVIVWTDPVIVTNAVTPNGPTFDVGGAESLTTPVVVPYGAPIGFGPKVPPQFSGAPITLSNLNAKTINYFGHSAAKFPYGETNASVPDTNTNYKYLALTIENSDLPPDTLLIESGTIHVRIRVYPK